MRTNNPWRQLRRMTWRGALLSAAPISLFILALFYDWFAVADRYAIFLYGHTTQGIPTAQPFDEVTSSRYWMSGLVASGAVLVLYTAFNGLLGLAAARRHHSYHPPSWRQVWLLCAPVLTIGILVITMTANAPTLPLALALACVAATLGGLALALAPGAWAAQRPLELLWLAFDSLGLMPTLLLLRAIELPARGVSVSEPLALTLAVGGTLAGVVWLGGMTALRLWRRRPLADWRALFAAGLCLSYVFLPLVHHLLATPPAYRYISTASNFFAYDPRLQTLSVAAAAGMAYGVTKLRERLREGDARGH